jgi:hypothetical protein
MLVSQFTELLGVNMPIYTVKLTKKEEVANETMAFHFEKPEGFTFRSG